MTQSASSGKSTARRPSKWGTPPSASRVTGEVRQVVSRGSPPRSPVIGRKSNYRGRNDAREGDRSREREDRTRSGGGREARSRSKRRHN